MMQQRPRIAEREELIEIKVADVNAYYKAILMERLCY